MAFFLTVQGRDKFSCPVIIVACCHRQNFNNPGKGSHLAKKSKDIFEQGHRSGRITWLRAAVLGANDGILSIASLVVGVAAANVDRHEVLIAGIAGLVAGAMSLAAGQYVAASSQADTEAADIEIERFQLETDHQQELVELAAIYVQRGLDEQLAEKVARQLHAHDALGAHARDELGISEVVVARPLLAAVTSAVAFALGAIPPLAAIALAPESHLVIVVALTALVFLAWLGGLAAFVGGASIVRGCLRLTIWGGAAMAVTAGVGRLFVL